MATSKTQIDPFDPKDIAAKLPALERKLEVERDKIRAEEARLKRRLHEIQATEAIIEQLRGVAGSPEEGAERGDGPTPGSIMHLTQTFLREAANSAAERQSVQDRVLEVVKKIDAPVRVDDVCQYLPGAKRDTVQWALWKAERDGELQRVSKGVYALSDSTPSLSRLILEEGGD